MNRFFGVGFWRGVRNGGLFAMLVFVGVFFSGVVLAEEGEGEFSDGRVPILEYHHIGETESRWTRSYDNFRGDLEWLYLNGYRAVSVEDFIDGDFDLEVGEKPVVLTFDDGSVSQFGYLEDGGIDPNSAIGIMNDFLEEYPDFGAAAVFYVNRNPFGDPDTVKEKLEYLLKSGRQIGNHTVDHTNLSKFSATVGVEKVEDLDRYVDDVLGRDLKIRTIAFPFGGVPKGELKEIEAGFLVGADPAYLPGHERFDAMRIPRIQAIDDEWKRWFRREPGFVGVNPESEVFEPYVVDEDGRGGLRRIKVKYVALSEVGGAGERVSEVDGGVEVERNEVEEVVDDSEEEGDGSAQNDGPQDGYEADGGGELVDNDEEKGDGLDGEDLKIETAEVEIQYPFQACEDFGERTMQNDSGNVGVKDFSLEDGLRLGEGFTQKVAAKFRLLAGDRWLSLIFPMQGLIDVIARIELREVPEGLVFEDGKYFYEVQEGDSLNLVADKLIGASKYYLTSQFKKVIVEANGGEFNFKAGDLVEIPDVELLSFRNYLPKVSRKGIYLTAYSAANPTGYEKIEQMIESGGNMVVVDVKEVDGKLSFDSTNSVASEAGGISSGAFDVKKFTEYWRSRGVYVVARVVIFKDEHLAKVRPEWAPQSRSRGGAWANREGVVWLDPSNSEVQDYYVELVKEVAELGVDEIQFDYIRFPALGNVADARYAFESKEGEIEKWQVIRDFLKKIDRELSGYDVNFSADVFGVVAWNDGYDGYIIGQKIECMAPYLDYIYPMVYPSHYGAGFGGIANPGGEPYEIVYRSLALFEELLEGTKAVQRPWYQGFAWGATGYGTGYVKEQVRAGKELGIHGFVIWNASNRYTESYPAFDF